MQGTLLIVDDKADVRLSLNLLLKNHGFQVHQAASLTEAKSQLQSHSIDVVLLDMNYEFDTTSGEEGLAFLSENKTNNAPLFIAMTAWSSIDLAVAAMQNGACDFFAKPWDNHAVLMMVKKHLGLKQIQQRQQHSRTTTLATESSSTLLWFSPVMQTLKNKIDRVAKTGANILLRGENGTGKSQMAHYIHQQSQLQGEFVSTNMAAIPESLFESEMFGHVKGAFTDAKQDRIGRFAKAQNGTLFLDEIGTLNEAQQTKLLRVLESAQFEAVGSSQTQQADCRIISATNAPLETLIEQGLFRNDLYYRINTIEFEIPPLRARLEDIISLAAHFIRLHSEKYQVPEKSLSAEAIQVLKHYHWPGNIRELSHVIERAVLMSDNEQIQEQDLQLKKQPAEPDSVNQLMTLDEAEKKLVKMALKQCQDNVEDAAALLGISKSAMYRRLDKFAIKTR
ncbi:sigma-54-dependent transcriptional regulator [Pseudoalteromonas sp. T1lg65]|uniref:sigma-54-dependent transcriptional regulator n=1 Tax=Pseudoalteromonas sp. T1lg65 TaxID=2077101 RepID=UPI003F7A15C7